MFCTRCGRQAEPGKAFCVHCGVRLPQGNVSPPVPQAKIPPQAAQAPWEGSPPPMRAPKRTGLYVLLGVAVVVLIAGGLVGGYLLTRDNGHETPEAVPGTTASLVSASSTLTSSTTVAESTTVSVTTSSTSSSTTTTLSPAATDDWPEVDGWTVIVESLDVADASSLSKAQDLAAAMSDKGIVAGVLFSSGYGSLRSGYWAIFSGIYETRAQAKVQQDWLVANGYPNAYARQVTR
jgi:hypothetical protein